jgi:hypothetical protein
MSREIFFANATCEAAINFDESYFGVSDDGVSPWTISVRANGMDVGRVVGFEGDGQTIIGMHQLKPDSAAKRGCEITVFRMSNELIENKTAASVFTAFERWLLRRGWRGNVVKKLKHVDENLVVPMRKFWIDNGFELVPLEEGKWDEHVVKRWR